MSARLVSSRPAPGFVRGLLPGDADRIRAHLDREPSETEWRLFGSLWSEHCAYRHSRPLLGTLFTRGPAVVQGPGENAGVVDLGDGLGIAIKAESHNHPSAVEPYEGAATGVGGILRDILALGARPVAVLDGLCFAPQSDPHARYLSRGIVDGVGGYGNAVGVPTVGGFVRVHPSYAGNPLVNVLALGTVSLNRIVYGRATQVGDLVVLFGATTGRDGAGGASFASETLSPHATGDRPMVQVGDPFAEKRLIEATLEILQGGEIHASQDLGAAGIASATSEMAYRGGTGMELDLAQVPLRQPDLAPWEILISESQERMAFTTTESALSRIAEIAERYLLTWSVIGRVTGSGRYVVRMGSETVVDLPLNLLSEAPPAGLPASPTGPSALTGRPDLPTPDAIPTESPGLNPHLAPDLLDETLRDLAQAVLTDPNVAPRTGIYETYDREVGARTALGPPGGAAVLALEGRSDAAAVTLDANPHLAETDPYSGAFLTVVESVQNLAAVGASPLGLTNCLNLGSPESAEGAHALRETIRGLDDAARTFAVPIVSGNVSLYNEVPPHTSIVPTASVGMVGHIPQFDGPASHGFTRPGDRLLLAGPLAGRWQGSMAARLISSPAAFGDMSAMRDLDSEEITRLCAFVRRAVTGRLVSFAADIWTGGLVAGLVRHLAGEARGALLSLPPPVETGRTLSDMLPILFGEGPGRFLLGAPAIAHPKIAAQAEASHVRLTDIGSLWDLPTLSLGEAGPAADDAGPFGSASEPERKPGSAPSVRPKWTLDLAEVRVKAARIWSAERASDTSPPSAAS